MMFLIGFYAGVAIVFFFITLFFCVLGGKDEDLWKPFVIGTLWPLFFFKKFRDMM